MVDSLQQFVLQYQEIIVLSVVMVASMAEWLHYRRIWRIERLAFGPSRKKSSWLKFLSLMTVVACGCLSWGLLSLLRTSGSNWDDQGFSVSNSELEHYVIALDVSPSMDIVDAGASRKQSRSERASQILLESVSRLEMSRSRISIVAFYSQSLPVVVETFDPAVVHNVLGDLPLRQAFPSGKTNLYSVFEKAAEIGKRWKKGSASLILCSDGDTLPADSTPRRPEIFKNVLIVGVGDANRGTFIHDHISRQDRRSLKQLANQMRGQYIDANTKLLDSALLSSIRTSGETKDFTSHKFQWIAICLGALWLALIPTLLPWIGGGWNPRKAGTRELSSKDFADLRS